MQFFDESLLATDGDYLITNDGAATYEISDDNKTIALTIQRRRELAGRRTRQSI